MKKKTDDELAETGIAVFNEAALEASSCGKYHRIKQ